MNAKRVSAAADLIYRAQENGKRTAAGIAADLDAACMLQSPEVAAELTAYRALELGDLDGRVSASCEKPGHPTWLRPKDDNRICPWCLADMQSGSLTAMRRELENYERIEREREANQRVDGSLAAVANLRIAELNEERDAAKNEAAQARRERDLIRERVSEPFGCTHCGVVKRGHGRRYISGVGMHAWERPTDEQVKDRMLARRAARAPWPGKLELDRAHEELIGTALSLYEEELETARLRLALKSAQRGRREMRSQRDEFCDRVDTLTAVAKGNKRHVQSLFAELQTMQRERDEARARVAELEAERHATNEALSEAAEALREQRDRIAGLEAERARYVGAEPTIAEELTYLSRCLDSVLAWCEKTEEQAPELVAEVRAAAEGMVDRESYPPALPWARLMDDEDLAEFLDGLAGALETAGARDALVEIEDTCGTWRAIAEAQHAHNTAPGKENDR
ncbi:hypothetical protein ACFY9A_28745 [Streptomyces rubradiris]|uniref:hypothetical protein n=1 Tax=Streptomyces rubradiris TaxID=285531 RepID=UPI0036E1B39B